MIETIIAGSIITLGGYFTGKVNRKKSPELPSGPRWTVGKQVVNNEIRIYVQDNKEFTEERVFIGRVNITEKPYKTHITDKYGQQIPKWVVPEDDFEDKLAELIAKAQDKAMTLNSFEEVIK
jgi:hypothetical protein